MVRFADYRGETNSAAILNLHLDADTNGKFVGYRFELESLQTHMLVNSANKNFEVLTAFYEGLQKEEKTTLDISHCESFKAGGKVPPEKVAAHAEYIAFLRTYFSEKEFHTLKSFFGAVIWLIYAISHIAEYRYRSEELSRRLGLPGNTLEPFFLAEFEQELAGKVRLAYLAECLYASAVNLAVKKVNVKFKQYYHEHFYQKLDDLQEIEPRKLTEVYDQNVKVINDYRYRKRLSHINQALGLEYSQLNPTHALELIDFPGFVDHGNLESDNRPDNGVEEMLSNLFYEHFLRFFNEKRFHDEKAVYEEQGIEKYWKNIKNSSNQNILTQLDTLFAALEANATVDEVKNSLSLPTYYKEVYKMLNTRLTGLNINDKPLFVSIDHSFSSTLAYNINMLHQSRVPPGLDAQFLDAFNDNSLINESVLVPAKRLLELYRHAAVYFSGLRATANTIFFLHCFKIERVRDPRDQNKLIFCQIEHINFESLIERSRVSYPFSCSYEYFLSKLNLMRKLEPINPFLNVDYRQFITQILTGYFGDRNSEQYFVPGKSKLFYRENFFFELEETFLKEQDLKKREQRVFGFVE